MSRNFLPAVAALALVAAACNGDDALPSMAPKSYAVEPSASSLALAQDDTLHIDALVRDVATNAVVTGTRARMSYAAVDPTIVGLTAGGGLQALKAGSTKIVATYRDEFGYPHSADVAVSVSAVPLSAVEFTTPDTTIYLDEFLTTKAIARDMGGVVRPLRPILYSLRDSVDNYDASVTSLGTVQPLHVSTVEVVAQAEGRADTIFVSVAQRAVATVTVTPATSTVTVGATAQLTATLRASNNLVLSGRAITWSSSDESVATVDVNGVVTAVSAPTGGATVTITATSEGKSGTAQVTVNPQETVTP